MTQIWEDQAGLGQVITNLNSSAAQLSGIKNGLNSYGGNVTVKTPRKMAKVYRDLTELVQLYGSLLANDAKRIQAAGDNVVINDDLASKGQ